jgi:hypothetical protein
LLPGIIETIKVKARCRIKRGWAAEGFAFASSITMKRGQRSGPSLIVK